MLEWEGEAPVGGKAYAPEVEDPSEAGALAATLWELAPLQRHYHPHVAQAAASVAALAPGERRRRVPGPWVFAGCGLRAAGCGLRAAGLHVECGRWVRRERAPRAAGVCRCRRRAQDWVGGAAAGERAAGGRALPSRAGCELRHQPGQLQVGRAGWWRGGALLVVVWVCGTGSARRGRNASSLPRAAFWPRQATGRLRPCTR
jgi:hypothetical protein